MGSKSIKLAELEQAENAEVQLSSPKREERPYLETVMGENKGRTIELKQEKLTIGRAEGNDIVVGGEGISRTHAFLGQTPEGWFIRDNQSKNGIQVNGNKVAESWLADGDVVQVGGFVFKFHEPKALQTYEAPQNDFMQSSAMDMGLGGANQMDGGVGAASPAKKPNRRVLIYGVVAAVLGLLYMAQNPGTTKEDGKDDPAAPKKEKLAREFETTKEPEVLDGTVKKPINGIEDPELSKAEQAMQGYDWTNSSLREAEQFFRKGQREYLTKNYGRAIDQFQTALSLYRGHILAEKYLRLTMYEAEVKAKKHMDMGIHYFESLQYQRAIYHFSEVVSLMQHRSTEPIIGEAERYINLSKRRLQAAELFP